MARQEVNAFLSLSLTMSLTVAGLAIWTGCASSSSGPSGASYTIDRDAPPALQLAARAEGEASNKPARGVVAFPPGADAQALAPHDAGNVKARMLLADALIELARPIPNSSNDAGTAAAPPSAAQLDRALRHYIRGRDEAAQRRYFVAINELQKAQALDPTSTRVIRELARSYSAFGSASRAAAEYEKLLTLDPQSPEAVLRVAMAAANRRDFERAAEVIASHVQGGLAFDDDPAAPILANYALSVALDHLGYDRASVDAAKMALTEPLSRAAPTVYRDQYGMLRRQAGQMWRSIGDACCRLEDFPSAMLAYDRASQLPLVDPDAVLTRRVYAAMKLNRPHTAQRAVLESLQTPDRPVTVRHISLCNYLKKHSGDTRLLAASVAGLYRSNPEDAGLARAAAALSSVDEAAAILGEFVDRQPRDLKVFGELIEWLVMDDPTAAVKLTVAQAATHPDLAESYVDRLAFAHPAPGNLVEQLRSGPESADRSLVEVRLLLKLGAVGDAWRVCDSALTEWPNDRQLAALLIETSAVLSEPALTEQAIARAAQFDDAEMWVTRARARRAFRQNDAAMAAAEQALDRDASNIDALVLLADRAVARAQRAVEANNAAERANWEEQARQLIDQAIAIDPSRDEAYAPGFVLYGPPAGSAESYQDLGQRLASANPESELLSRLIADQLVSQRRFEAALERLLHLHENSPSNSEYLRLAVMAWKQLDRTEDARRWLDEQLARRPGDPVLLGQWARVLFDLGRTDEAVARLETVIEKDRYNIAAMQLLEAFLQMTGETDRAMALGLDRLERRPRGVQRELELAALHIAAGRSDQAITHLKVVMTLADQAGFDRLATATSLASNLTVESTRKFEIMLKLVQTTVERHPACPLPMYGRGLIAMAGLDLPEETFDAFLRLAIDTAAGARGATTQFVLGYRDIAQQLVSDGHPAAAARVLRARADAVSYPLAADARGFLIQLALAADIVADDQETSIEVVRRLHREQKLGLVFPNLDADRDLLANALYELALRYSMGQNEAGALRCLEEAVAIEPDFAMALNNLGYTRLERNLDDPRTIEYIERAYALSPNDPNVLDTIGWLRYKQGRFEDKDGELGAISLIEQSMQKDANESAEVLEHLGDAMWRIGDTDKARQFWRRSEARHENTKRLLGDPARHQLGFFGLIILDPEVYYNRLIGDAVRRVQAKIRDAVEADEPRIAQTFKEIKNAAGEEARRNGRTQ